MSQVILRLGPFSRDFFFAFAALRALRSSARELPAGSRAGSSPVAVTRLLTGAFVICSTSSSEHRWSSRRAVVGGAQAHAPHHESQPSITSWPGGPGYRR